MSEPVWTGAQSLDDPARLEAVFAYGVLDTPREARFDRLTRLVARTLGVPISLITIADGHRVWFKSAHGTDWTETQFCDVPHGAVFCAEVVSHDQALVVEDAAADTRFADHPDVLEGGIGFYAGVPLRSPLGHSLGTLCAIDRAPRKLMPGELSLLEDLAETIVDEMDLTRHFRALEEQKTALERSETKTREALDAMQGGFFALDRAWRITGMNKAAEPLMQRRREDVIGQVMWDVFPEAVGTLFHEQFHRAVREGEAVEFAAYFEPYGVWFEARAFPFEGGLSVYFNDITERKAAEQAVLASEARFRRLVQNSSDVVTLIGADGTLLHLSESGERLTGYRAEDRVGQSYLAKVAPEDEALVREAFESVVAGAPQASVLYRYVSGGGALLWGESRLTNLLADPHVGAVVVNSRDVTEQVEATERLEASELKHRAVVEQSGQLVYAFDVESGAITWSGNVEGITGMTAEAFAEVDIAGWEARIHPEDREAVLALLARSTETLAPYEVAYRFRHADGTYRHIEDHGVFRWGVQGDRWTLVGLMRDVTERWERESALRESEGRYRALSHLVQTFAYAYDVPDDGSTPRISWITGSVEEVLGRPATEFEGMPWGGHVSDEHRSLSEERLEAALRDESRVDDMRLSGREGEERWIRFVSQPEVDPVTGRVVRIYGAGQDVTAQKEAEANIIEARRRAEELQAQAEATAGALEAALRDQRRILDHSLDVICAIDAEGRFLQVSAAAEQMWRYTPDELEGRLYMDFVHPDDHEDTIRIAQAIVNGEKIYDFRNRYIRKDGTVVPMMWSAVWSEEDQQVLCVARDRSEAEAQEERLRQSQERLRLITEATSDVLWDWDLRTDDLWWGAGVMTYFGYTKEDTLKGTALRQGGMHPDDMDRVLGGIQAAIEAGEPMWSDEYRFRKADGSYVDVFDRGRILRDAQGMAVRMVGGMMDITAEKETEAALVAAKDRAEEMSRLKDAFLANMSHEIRTPLTSILGFAELLRDVVDEEGREFVEIIEAGGRRLKETLTSVLELSQLEAGQVTLAPVRLDVARVAGETANLLGREAERKGIEISTSSVPATLFADVDRGALGRILFNLIGNAVKFTGQGGRVSVATTGDGEQVCLTVTDDGPGMSPEFLPRLFDAFRQESQGHSRSHEGSGLGLTITKRLVELMGGTIAVESALGTGTTFTVRLPRGVGAGSSAVAAAGVAPSVGHERRVLLVEDDEGARRYVRLSLRGAEVVEAASAEAALSAALSAVAPFDVVLLDINLGPGESGEAVLPALRAVASCRAARFVAMTAYALPGDEARFGAAGFDAYLAKPFRRADLAVAVG